MNEKRCIPFNLRLTQTEKDAIMRAADDLGLTASDLIRDCVRERIGLPCIGGRARAEKP